MARAKDETVTTDKSPEEGIRSAITICRLRGAQVTPLREAVLTALWRAEGPIGAYELRGHLSETLGRTISATSIYRSLEFLCDQGVAARIESRNAYVACTHPEHEHTCIHFVCNACGSSSEIEDRRLERLLAADAKDIGFAIDHRVIELSGSCAECQRAPA